MADIARKDNATENVGDVAEVEKAASLSADDGFDPVHMKKIRQRIDLRLIPALGAMYGICLMDRNNLPNAAIAGMLVDLDMVTGSGYNISNMSFVSTVPFTFGLVLYL